MELLMNKPRYVLTFYCKNRPGIVAAVSNFLFSHGSDIREAQQFDDIQTGNFFARIAFDIVGGSTIEELREAFVSTAQHYDMKLEFADHRIPKRVLILVSKFDHCLVDLLYRSRIGELTMQVAGIVSNHPASSFHPADIADHPFHYLPVSTKTRMEQEAQIWGLVQETKADLIVLARYMQVLSNALVAKLAGNCINIHHSFLPGFKGAKPYHQAHGRGVKLIGATAHYVTTELDEGPIIEQDVERISHADTPDDLVSKGRDIERRVLARAVRYHLEDRVLLSGNKTIVFRT